MIKKILWLIIVGFFSINITAYAQQWQTRVQEALDALQLAGDVAKGEEVYEICSACHMSTAWGTPAGAFPQLAGQHSGVLIKQIVDIRTGNRTHPTMRPFAIQLGDSQEIADVTAYIQTLPKNPKPTFGPGGISLLLTNSRKDISENTLDQLGSMTGKELNLRLIRIGEISFNSKKAFSEALLSLLGSVNKKKYEKLLFKYADWSTDLSIGESIYKNNCTECHGDSGLGDAKNYYPVVAGQTYLYVLRQLNWIKNDKRKNANPEMIKKIKNFSDLEMRSVADYTSRL